MSKTNKNVQIPYDMFLDIYRLVSALQDVNLDFNTRELLKRLEGQTEVKIDAMQKHNVYTQSKMGVTEEEREKARKEYLNIAGIHKDWRY